MQRSGPPKKIIMITENFRKIFPKKYILIEKNFCCYRNFFVVSQVPEKIFFYLNQSKTEKNSRFSKFEFSIFFLLAFYFHTSYILWTFILLYFFILFVLPTLSYT